ncbi:MAG: hypothetical protein NC299_15940 [Lachnospiraceae bacterium]|nr:hypothetical protein [Ruminococcus sp.]MCM1276826.1 hypothetical protein [Lachnospiraceae bacterium]
MDNMKLKERLNSKIQTIEERTNDMDKTDLATTNNYPALTNNAIDIIRDNLKRQPLSFQLFDVVKSPSGGSTVFSVPGIAGDEAAKELTGIILDYTTPRAYWDTPDPVEGTPPVCFSQDSIISHEGKACTTCQFNDFGSKDGDSNAKACKESVALFLLRPDNIMPIIVRVPVSSKLRFQRYMTRLVGRMIPLSSVVTRITLEKATNRTGQPYSLFNFEVSEELAPEEAVSAKAFANKFMEFVNTADIERKVEQVS